MTNARSMSYMVLYSVLLMSAFCLLLIAGLRPIGFDRDSQQYLTSYIDFTTLVDSNYLDKEPSFWIITYLCKLISSESIRPLLVIYAFLGVSINIIAIKRLTPYPLIAVFCFTFLFFPLHTMTQIRVGVACAIFLLAIPDIVERNLKSFLFKAAFATMFHYSATVIFTTYLVNHKTINFRFYFTLPIVALLSSCYSQLFFSVFNFVTVLLPSFLGHKVQMYIALLEMDIGTQINLLSIYYTGLLIMYYFCVFNIDKFKSKYDIVFIKLLGWLLFIYYFMSFLPAIAFRVSEIFSVVIIFIFPSIVRCFKQKFFVMVAISSYVLLLFFNNVFVHSLFKF